MSKTIKSGFTLVELLVVISIIALLVSILMPALGKARKQAQQLVCSAHMKQFGLATHLYSMDNNDHLQACIGSSLPESHPDFLSEDPATMVTWDKALDPYLASEVEDPTVNTDHEDIFSCPTDKVERGPDDSGNDRRKRSYSQVFYYNIIGKYNKPGEPWWPWHNSYIISRAQHPSETILFTDWQTFHNLRHYNNPGSIIHFTYWNGGWPGYDADVPSPREAKYHGNGNVYLFLDGHGEPLTPEEPLLTLGAEDPPHYWRF